MALCRPVPEVPPKELSWRLSAVVALIASLFSQTPTSGCLISRGLSDGWSDSSPRAQGGGDEGSAKEEARVNDRIRAKMAGIVAAAGASELALGMWMALAPTSFFEVLGGFGAQNVHYVRDVSTIYLALRGVLLL